MNPKFKVKNLRRTGWCRLHRGAECCLTGNGEGNKNCPALPAIPSLQEANLEVGQLRELNANAGNVRNPGTFNSSRVFLARRVVVFHSR